MSWCQVVVLAIVQGLTEFLPVSSDGHLSITQQAFAALTGRRHSGAENLFFDVMLHLGTLAAIVVHYRSVVKTGAKGLLGSTDVPPPYRRASVVRTALLAGVATTPLIPLALFLKKWIEAAFESTAATGFGFLITLGRPPLDLRDSPLLIPVAQALVALPLVVRVLVPVLSGIDDRLRQAAATLGASPARALLVVDLPVIWKPLLAAAGFAFACSLGEFGATSFLVRDDRPTLPVVIFRSRLEHIQF